MTDCVNAAPNQQDIPTLKQTHAHARALTHLYSVFDQATQPTRTLATASSPDRLLRNTGRLPSLLEHSQSPIDQGCQRGKASTLKVVIESALPLTPFEAVNLNT